MLDYKDIIIKHYGLGMSGREIAKLLSISKSGVNDFLAAFKKCDTLSFPLPEGITNYAIANHVYGPPQPSHGVHQNDGCLYLVLVWHDQEFGQCPVVPVGGGFPRGQAAAEDRQEG